MNFKQFLIEYSDAFPPLYHGTSSDRLAKTGQFTDEPIYLTAEEEDAVGYAQGAHLGGSGGKNKYIITVAAQDGKIFNADEDIQEIIADQHEQFETIDQLLQKAKKQGYRYVQFLHPAIDSNEEVHTVVSLHPTQDLQIVDVEKA